MAQLQRIKINTSFLALKTTCCQQKSLLNWLEPRSEKLLMSDISWALSFLLSLLYWTSLATAKINGPVLSQAGGSGQGSIDIGYCALCVRGLGLCRDTLEHPKKQPACQVTLLEESNRSGLATAVLWQERDPPSCFSDSAAKTKPSPPLGSSHCEFNKDIGCPAQLAEKLCFLQRYQ